MQVRIPQLFEEIAANKPHGLRIESALQGSRHNCYAGDDNTRKDRASISGFSVLLCATSVQPLCSLCLCGELLL
jgi:hypothetical protein